VRPTRATLDDLGQPIPNLGIALEDLGHPVIVRAQQLPERVDAGGVERIAALDDRPWFKVKVDNWRAVAIR
jgi:hypothetical protein